MSNAEGEPLETLGPGECSEVEAAGAVLEPHLEPIPER